MLIERDRLDFGAIEQLVREDILAICVRNFVTEDIAGKLSE